MTDANTMTETEAPATEARTMPLRSEKLATRKALNHSTALDAAVAEVRDLNRAATVSFWKLGQKILALKSANLWKLRVGDDGKSLYGSSWSHFVRAELEMSTSYAAALIAATQFTEEKAIELGVAKIMQLSKAHPDDQPQLMEGAKDVTVRELAAQVQEKREERGGYTKPGQQAAAGKASAEKRRAKATDKHEATKAAPIPDDKVTVAKLDGVQTLALYEKPVALAKGVDITKCTRAKVKGNGPTAKFIRKVQPFTCLDVTNGVVMRISLKVDAKGALSIRVDTRRESVIPDTKANSK